METEILTVTEVQILVIMTIVFFKLSYFTLLRCVYMCVLRILEWIAIPFSRGSSQPRDQTRVSCTAAGFFSAEPLGKPLALISS